MNNIIGWALSAALLIGGIVGWVSNLLNVANATGIDGQTIVQAIGIIIVPLGAILGWVM